MQNDDMTRKDAAVTTEALSETTTFDGVPHDFDAYLFSALGIPHEPRG